MYSLFNLQFRCLSPSLSLDMILLHPLLHILLLFFLLLIHFFILIMKIRMVASYSAHVCHATVKALAFQHSFKYSSAFFPSSFCFLLLLSFPCPFSLFLIVCRRIILKDFEITVAIHIIWHCMTKLRLSMPSFGVISRKLCLWNSDSMLSISHDHCFSINDCNLHKQTEYFKLKASHGRLLDQRTCTGKCVTLPHLHNEL